MKPVTWMYVGGVFLILMAAAGICVGGFILLGASGGAQGVTGIGTTGMLIGSIALIGGIALIILAVRKTKQETAQNVTYQVDLPGETKIEEVKCRACGGTLSAKDVTLTNGALMVNCPWCHTIYQMTEEPKW
jgi:hypothetical protein